MEAAYGGYAYAYACEDEWAGCGDGVDVFGGGGGCGVELGWGQIFENWTVGKGEGEVWFVGGAEPAFGLKGSFSVPGEIGELAEGFGAVGGGGYGRACKRNGIHNKNTRSK